MVVMGSKTMNEGTHERRGVLPAMSWSRYNVWVEHDDGWHVFNGVTGSIVRVETDERTAIDDFLDGVRPAANHAALIERLLQMRALVAADTDEVELLQKRFQRSSTGRDHLGLTVITSMGCNFDCPYCFEHKTPAKLTPEVSDEILRLLDARIDEIDSCSVTWYGGEPLLAPDALVSLSTTMAERCAAAGVSYQSIILTNGWHLDEAMAKRLAAAHVHHAQVTIDGPAEIHDVMRPHITGRPTFERIVDNLAVAADHLPVTIRVNADRHNIDRLDELMERLAAAGLAGLTPIALGHILPLDHNPDAPSASYTNPCLTIEQFGDATLAFDELARSHGFETGGLPNPLGSPCTAVKSNELIVGANGELWKCLDDAGDLDEQIGTIFDLSEFNHRAAKWFAHDPFTDDECRDCVALPVCMGGCSLIGRLPGLRDNRCSTFRTHHTDQVADAVERGADRHHAMQALTSLAIASAPVSVPVTIGVRP